MKTVTSTLTLTLTLTVTLFVWLAVLSIARPIQAGPKVPAARLLDMYAVKDGDSYVVHVLASGDISQFLSDRKNEEGSYRLTLDVPALSPLDSKYDVNTPFSRSFQVWPMQLGKKVYSRIEIELTIGASSVVGLENASHLFVRIHRDGPTPAVTASAEPRSTSPTATDTDAATEPVLVPESVSAPEHEAEPQHPPAPLPLPVPVTASGAESEAPLPESASQSESESESESNSVTAAASADGSSTAPSEDELFFSLFPTPARQQQTLFNIAADDAYAIDEPVGGIRVGRFDVEPSVDLSWIRGNNLLLAPEGPFVDRALLVRGRVVATLLDSVHDLKLSYEGRYRDFENFQLDEKFTQFLALSTRLAITPTTSAKITERYVRGAFESQEFDPGGEVVASTDPFYRNFTEGVFSFDFSERFGAEVRGSYNAVEFLEPSADFFDYTTTTLGGAFLYDLSPLTSLVGEYERVVIPEPLERPEAGSVGDLFLFGVRGELTSTLRGEAKAGYAIQRYQNAFVPQDYSGFVADASLTRDFGDKAALTARLGRRTNPSAYDLAGYYVSTFARLQFITPFVRNFRFTATTAFYNNGYPVANEADVVRDDNIFSGGLGVAYFFTPVTYLSFDYRHDQRSSNLDEFIYRNNALQVMVGFGFVNH